MRKSTVTGPPSAAKAHRRRGARWVVGFTFATAAATLAATGCARSDARLTEDDALRAEVTLRSLMAAFERADTALIEDLFWPAATYDDFPNQHTYQGIAEIVGYVTGVHAWADDVVMNVGEVHVTEDGAVAEWLFSAVQSRPMGDQLSVGTGNEVVLNGVTVIELDGERIIRAADYTDTGAMLLQLGARIEMPDGTTMLLDDIRQ